MAIRIIEGDFADNGYITDRAALRVLVDKTGALRDADFVDEPMWCRQYGADAPILTNGCWDFIPDAGELERCGIVPEQMIAA